MASFQLARMPRWCAGALALVLVEMLCASLACQAATPQMHYTPYTSPYSILYSCPQTGSNSLTFDFNTSSSYHPKLVLYFMLPHGHCRAGFMAIVKIEKFIVVNIC